MPNETWTVYRLLCYVDRRVDEWCVEGRRPITDIVLPRGATADEVVLAMRMHKFLRVDEAVDIFWNEEEWVWMFADPASHEPLLELRRVLLN